jgi:hypothetical protein
LGARLAILILAAVLPAFALMAYSVTPLTGAAAVLVGVVGARLLILRPTQALVRTAERLKAR